MENAAIRHQEKLRHDIGRLRHQGFGEAVQRAEGQQTKAMERAQIRGNTVRGQQESGLRAADIYLRNAALQKAQEQTDIASTGQLAHQQQAQEQHAMNEARRKFETERDREMNLLAFQHNIAKGLPIPVSTTQTMSGAPPAPPIGVNVLGGMMGQLQQLAGGQPQQRAKGGRVKRHFAGGGMPQWGALMQQVERGPYDQQQEQIAEELRNYQHDPVRNWTGHVSSQLLMDPSGSGLKAMGRGAYLAQRDRDAAYDKSMALKGTSAGLYHKLNEAKLHQQQFLGQYEAHRAQHEARIDQNEEMRRHHGAQEQHWNNSLQAENERYIQKAAAPTRMTAQDRKQILQAKHDIANSIKFKGLIDKTRDVYSKLDTGPNIGAIADKGWDTTAAMGGLGNVSDIGTARTLGSNLVTHAHQAFKNIPRAHSFVELIEKTKPNFRNTPEANKASFDELEEAPRIAMEEAIDTLESMGMSQEEIQDYIRKVSAHPDKIHGNAHPRGMPESGKNRHSHHQDVSQMSNEELIRIAAGG
jgi:hypothetical protein